MTVTRIAFLGDPKVGRSSLLAAFQSLLIKTKNASIKRHAATDEDKKDGQEKKSEEKIKTGDKEEKAEQNNNSAVNVNESFTAHITSSENNNTTTYEVHMNDVDCGDDNLLKLSCYGQDMFVLCFDLTNSDSFENIKSKWFSQTEYSRNSLNICILIGLKSDLTAERQVTYDEVKQYAYDNDICNYFECSLGNEESLLNAMTGIVDTDYIYYDKRNLSCCNSFCRCFLKTCICCCFAIMGTKTPGQLITMKNDPRNRSDDCCTSLIDYCYCKYSCHC